MTYRNDASYLRFPKSMKKKAGSSLSFVNTEMNNLIEDNKKQPRLQDELAVTKSQNAFDGIEIDE